MLIWPCVQTVPGKNGELSPSGYNLHHGKAAQSLSKDQLAWLHLRPCLVPSWCGASRNIWDCCWSWGILGPHRAAPPATLPKRKPGVKMNEYAGLHRNFLFMKLSLVCLPRLNVVYKQLSIFGRKLALLWKWVKSIRRRRENGVETLKLHHDTLSKTWKTTLIGEDRNKDGFKNWQLCSVSKLPFCDHRTIRLTQNCVCFTNLYIKLLVLSSVSCAYQP